MTDTVTLTRAKYDAMLTRLRAYDALLEELEDAQDIAIANERRNDRRIPGEVVSRLLDGDSPVTVWREHRGLTQRALAKAAGISPAMMTEIEKGGRTPSLSVAQALAGALGVSLDDLFSAD